MSEKLAKLFRDKVAKSKDNGMKIEAEASIGYSTGFLSLDYLNGTVIHVKTKDKNFKYNSVGILDGSATTIIGRSGCGKTTLLLQIGSNIIRPFKTSSLFIDDIEGGANDRRIEILTRMDTEEIAERIVYRNTGITSENLYERIKMIHDMKVENKQDYIYDTGYYDYKGERIYKLEPTVYMIDSIPLIMPKNIIEEDEMGGQMSATAIAKSNTFFFKKISQLLKEANIILLCINHILDDVQINPFAKKKLQLSYLKEGERLPGGRAAIYLANNMFRVDDNSKLKESEAFGIDGYIVDVTMLKSRTNKCGKSVPMVFNLATGFDPDLSLFLLLKAEKRINGAGVSFYIDDRNDIKYSQRNFKEKLANNPELQQIFAQACYEVLCGLISDVGGDEEEKVFSSDVSSLIYNMGQSELVA